jgi:hypothetical protein
MLLGAPAKVTSAVAVKPGASSLQILIPLLDWMRTSRSDEASLLITTIRVPLFSM